MNQVLEEHAAVAFVTAGIQLSIRYRIFYRTVGLVRMGTIRKTAAADVGTQVAKVPGHLLGYDVPQFKLPHSRRIDDVTTGGQRQQFANHARTEGARGSHKELQFGGMKGGGIQPFPESVAQGRDFPRERVEEGRDFFSPGNPLVADGIR